MQAGAYSIYKQQQQRKAAESARIRANAEAEQRREAEKRLKDLENFCDAAAAGDLQTVKNLLNRVEINKVCKAYTIPTTALFLASIKGHTDVVSFLLANGANIEKSAREETPLWMAARYGRLEVVKILVQKGALINKKCTDNRTPLAVAAKYGHTEVVRYLIDAKADMECKDQANNTPLISAIFGGHIGVIQVLIQKKANLEHTGNEDFSPLYVAVQENKEQIGELLLKAGVNVHFGSSKSQVTPLHKAATEGNIPMVELLLEYKADIDFVVNVYKTPLIYAISNKKLEMVKFLIGKRAKVDPSKPMCSPLMEAARLGNLGICRYLIEEGANLDFLDEKGNTALYHAVINNKPQIISLLVERGASLNRDKPQSYLTLAVIYEATFSIEALAKAGMNINEEVLGMTRLYVAIEDGYYRSANTLLELGAKLSPTPTQLFQRLLVKKDKLAGMNLLMRLFPESASDKYNGKTIVHAAVEKEDFEVLDLLAEKGVDLNIACDGQTPLHFAATLGKIGVMAKLADLEAIVDPTDLQGNTPLLLAASYGQVGCVQLLIDRKVDSYHQNLLKEDALWKASISGHLNVIKLLLDRNFNPKLHYEDYQKLSESFDFEEQSRKDFQSNMKVAAIEIVLSALDEYDTQKKPKRHESRDGGISSLKASLDSCKPRASQNIGDVLNLVHGVIKKIEDQKLHGWRGPKKSKLYQGLNTAALQIEGLVNVIKAILGKKHEALFPKTS